MTNIYVNKFKNIATAYYEKVCSLRAKAGYNTTTYNEQVAKDYNAEIESEITRKANSAIDEINSVFEEVKKKISIRNFVCGENYNPDTAVFDSKILNQEEFNILIQKYYRDYDFVSVRRLVSAYPELAKLTGSIRTASDYVSVYRDFAIGAIKLILSMRENPRFSKVQLDSFADENFSSNLYAIVGSGQAIIPTTVTDKNEFMSHSFDSVTLGVPSNSEMNFNFNGVR